MILNNSKYGHLFIYNLNKDHLLQEYQAKYIQIQKENIVGNFPNWSAPNLTGNFFFLWQKGLTLIFPEQQARRL